MKWRLKKEKMKNNYSSNNQIQVHLEEYKALRSEINSRLAHQDHLLNWSLIFFTGISGLMFSYPASLNTLVQMRLQWILLFVPLIFISVGFDYQSQYFMMANLARYLNLNLRPRICSLLALPAEAALMWEDYLSESRSKSGLIEKIAWNARYILIVAMALIWWLFFIFITLIYFKTCWTIVEWTLVIIDAIGIGALIWSSFPIIAKFRQVTRLSTQGQESTSKQASE